MSKSYWYYRCLKDIFCSFCRLLLFEMAIPGEHDDDMKINGRKSNNGLDFVR